MSDNSMLSVMFICGAAIIITIAILVARAPHVCTDSIATIGLADQMCSGGAKAEVSKLDGKNIVICRCPEKK